MAFPLLSSLPPWMLVFSGTAIGWLRSFWSTVWENTFGRMERLISVKVLVEEADHEEAYRWIGSWAEKHLSKKKITDLALRRKMKDRAPEDRDEEYDVIPNYGTYWFLWNKRLVIFKSRKEQGSGTSDSYSGSSSLKAKRSASVAIWGTRKKDILFKAIEEAKDTFEALSPKSLKYYTHSGEYWSSNYLTRRPMNTIYLPQSIKDDIISDIQGFFESEAAYRQVGIPWRRGYLFFGPPGTGKSVTVQSLANHFSIPIYYLNLNSVGKPENLIELIAAAVRKSIILIEDVDCISAAKEGRDDSAAFTIKTNDLLNCIDGILATEGRILIMTTNHIEKLDPALIRSGRVDRRYHLEHARQEELLEFYENAKKHFNMPSEKDFLKSLPSPCTIADAQAVLFKKSLDI